MSAKESFRLGVAQITSTDNIAENLKQIETLWREAKGADLVVFPENSLFFRIQSGAGIEGLKWSGPEMARLQNLVDQGDTGLMLTTPLDEGLAKLPNATLFFAPSESPRVLYRKVHLFDVDVAGTAPVRESDFFVAGREPAIFTWRDWKFGLSICYDLRFAELYAHYAEKVDVILVPAAFLVPTGEAHWHVLLRARAIENQCYVAAPAQCGEHRSGGQVRKTFGHSLVIEPWGKVLAELKESPQLVISELHREAIAKVRRQIPMAGHRRL